MHSGSMGGSRRILRPETPVVVLTVLASLVSGALLLGACSGPTAATKKLTSGKGTRNVSPLKIVPGPAGLEAGSQPQPNGQMWVLAGAAGSKTIQSINLVDPKAAPIVPVSSSADTLAQSSSGLLAVGYGLGSSGSVEFRNGSTGALMKTVPVAGPVSSLVAAEDGFSFYALLTVNGARSVSVINADGGDVTKTIPVPSDSIAAAPDPLQHELYVLGSGGDVTTISLASDRPTTRFAVGQTPVQMALSSDGTRLYVLKGAQASCNVGIIDTTTQTEIAGMSAPANCIDIESSGDNRYIYDLVGTPALGNIQVYALSSR
jgi:DNA-binding beta-propeller fold protein YncE